MTDAGFFRGTSADQDNRFADKQKKMLKELNHSPILNTKLNMSKIDIENLRPWIEDKIKEILEKDDDILSESIFEHLTGKEPDGKNLLLLLTGLVEEDNKASKFMEELWTKLLDIQQNSNGISPKSNVAASPGNGLSDEKRASEASIVNTNDDRSGDLAEANLKGDGQRQSRSRSRTPQAEESGSKDRSQPRSKSRSRSNSKGGSKTRSKSPSKSDSRSRSRSRSNSQRRPSRSRSRSTSKSRQSRGRFRRSRSRSSSYTRGRRGYLPRGSYRGYGYPDRRRGGPIRPTRGRRPISPPWPRRRSPLGYRRRRSPSRSPRRTYRSHSKSPPYGHMMGRRSPRPPFYSSGPMVPRHMPPHDVHRPIIPSASPRGPPSDYARGYNEPILMAGHSSTHMMGRSHDLPPKPHGISSGPSRPYDSAHFSPDRSSSSERRRHKKDKKHRKHKKSKKRRSSSSSPDRRKKHKKHKKSKKHKS